MNVDDPGQGFDRSADLRVDAEAAGDRDLDLALGQAEHDRYAATAAGLASDQALQMGKRPRLAKKHPQPRRGMGDDVIKRLDLLHDQPQAVFLAADIDGDGERPAVLEQCPRLL